MYQPGLMMDRPLMISDIIEHASSQFGDVEVVSRETHGPLFRYNYAQCAVRARKLANALSKLGLSSGNAVGSIAWNNHRHLEAYFAVSGSGMVMHTCNPRLHPQQLIYIINHADDAALFFDTTFAPLIKGIAAHCPKVKAWICLSDAANMPVLEGVPNVLCFEDLIAGESEQFDWPQFDERSGAALCYTSGTTGNPKGALYSHRAIVLNALSGCLPAVLSLSPQESILPVVPMFHINAWCIPYAAPIAGARLVLPGPRLDGASLYELMESRAGNDQRRGADHLVGLAATCRAARSEVFDDAPNGGRRFGDARRIDCKVCRELRRRSAPRLGHDRNHRGGNHECADTAESGVAVGRAARHHCQAREIGLRR